MSFNPEKYGFIYDTGEWYTPNMYIIKIGYEKWALFEIVLDDEYDHKEVLRCEGNSQDMNNFLNKMYRIDKIKKLLKYD